MNLKFFKELQKLKSRLTSSGSVLYYYFTFTIIIIITQESQIPTLHLISYT